MIYDKIAWEKCVTFHGHICPGLVNGFKVAKLALKALGIERAGDEDLIAVVENDACGIDAVQVITGCTLGKGNLIFKDYGKQVYTFGNRLTGEAVRIKINPQEKTKDDEEHQLLRKKVFGGMANPEEKQLFQQKQLARVEKLLAISDEEFCSSQKISFEFPKKARIFATVICEECGEGAMEPRIRIKNGKKVCLPCFGEEYSRGW